MSFTPTTAVAATKTILEGVAEIGRVHNYRRTILSTPDMHRHLFAEPLGKIAGAFISVPRVGASRDFGNPTVAGVLTSVIVQVEMFRGLEDAAESELAFRAAVFAVLQAINTRGKIDAFASHQGPAEASQIGYIAFTGDTVLHYALLSFELRGRTSPTA